MSWPVTPSGIGLQTETCSILRISAGIRAYPLDGRPDLEPIKVQWTSAKCVTVTRSDLSIRNCSPWHQHTERHHHHVDDRRIDTRLGQRPASARVLPVRAFPGIKRVVFETSTTPGISSMNSSSSWNRRSVRDLSDWVAVPGSLVQSLICWLASAASGSAGSAPAQLGARSCPCGCDGRKFLLRAPEPEIDGRQVTAGRDIFKTSVASPFRCTHASNSATASATARLRVGAAPASGGQTTNRASSAPLEALSASSRRFSLGRCDH